jgi:hypothetical protein
MRFTNTFIGIDLTTLVMESFSFVFKSAGSAKQPSTLPMKLELNLKYRISALQHPATNPIPAD